MAEKNGGKVRIWLQQNRNDLRTARVVMDARPPLIESALFHCQQAVEKAMKAFLTLHDTPFRKTHDLDELARSCESIDATLKETLDPARDLTVFAWVFRYLGDSESPSEEVAYDAIVQARR